MSPFCIVCVTRVHKGRRRICASGRQRTWSVFSSRIWRRPSHSICKSAFKKSLERTHSTNAILFGELTKNIALSVCNFSRGECDSIFSWFVSVSWVRRVCSSARQWPSKCALPRLALKMELTNWLFYICGNWLLGWSHHLSLGALFFIVPDDYISISLLKTALSIAACGGYVYTEKISYIS